LLFSLAVYTKQTAVAAPLAAVLVLLVANRRDAIRLVAAGLAISLAALAVTVGLTGGGFLRHLVLYNINRFNPQGLERLGSMVLVHCVIVALAALGAAEGLRRVAAGQGGARWRDVADAIRCNHSARIFCGVILYVSITTPLLLFMLKSGAAANYMLEWFAGCAALVGLLFGLRAQQVIAGAQPPLRLGALALALTTQVAIFPLPAHAQASRSEAVRSRAVELIERVRVAGGPVLSDDMLLQIRAGTYVPWESAIFAELASLQQWDERLITDLIRAGHFAFVITEGVRGEWLFDSRYNPAVADAIDAAFPRQLRRGRFVIRLPAEGG
jgi:hypothetical protein